MEWNGRARLALGLACAAVLLVGYDSGSCGEDGSSGEPPQARSDLRPGPTCGSVCQIWCEHGNVLDADGCATCACNPDPGTRPDPGAGGSGAGGSAGGVCGDALCDVWCEFGHVLDADGCPTCACNPGRPQPPADHCTDLGERACNATPGCLGLYDDACVCSPCPDDVDCFCDCPDSSEPAGPFLSCVVDRPATRSECSTDADCRGDGVCEPYVTCMAIGCPPPGMHCVYPSCRGAVLNNDNECVQPDGRVVDLACCRRNAQ